MEWLAARRAPRVELAELVELVESEPEYREQDAQASPLLAPTRSATPAESAEVGPTVVSAASAPPVAPARQQRTAA